LQEPGEQDHRENRRSGCQCRSAEKGSILDTQRAKEQSPGKPFSKKGGQPQVVSTLVNHDVRRREEFLARESK
jgi:hypothetical protein